MLRDCIELFYLGSESDPCGAVATTRSEGRFSCRVTFFTPDGQPAGGAAVIQTGRSILDWTDFDFVSDGQSTRGAQDRKGVTIAGERVAHAGAVLPSYGLSALVLEMVQGANRSAEFGLLDESAPPACAVEGARLSRVGTEGVDSPVMGLVPECERIELTVGDRRTNTYWVSDGVIVASDWVGARSFALPVAAADALRLTLGPTVKDETSASTPGR